MFPVFTTTNTRAFSLFVIVHLFHLANSTEYTRFACLRVHEELGLVSQRFTNWIKKFRICPFFMSFEFIRSKCSYPFLSGGSIVFFSFHDCRMCPSTYSAPFSFSISRFLSSSDSVHGPLLRGQRWIWWHPCKLLVRCIKCNFVAVVGLGSWLSLWNGFVLVAHHPHSQAKLKPLILIFISNNKTHIISKIIIFFP